MVSGRRASLAICCRLPATSQLGESIELGFISGFIDGDTHYVDRLLSEYTEGLITAYVYLKSGYHNPYLWQLRTRAQFESERPFAIEQEMDEFEVQDYLRSLYRPAPGAVTRTAEREGQTEKLRGDNGIKRKKNERYSAVTRPFIQPCPLKCPPVKHKPRFQAGNGVYCRERGIRTPGPVTVSGFQDRRNRPLCQLSLKNYELKGVNYKLPFCISKFILFNS